MTAGFRHTCGLSPTGAAFCWRDNTHGQVGDGTTVRRSTPTAVAGGQAFAYIKAGDLFTCGVRQDGQALFWGDNEFGQLGNGTTGDALVPTPVAR